MHWMLRWNKGFRKTRGMMIQLLDFKDGKYFSVSQMRSVESHNALNGTTKRIPYIFELFRRFWFGFSLILTIFASRNSQIKLNFSLLILFTQDEMICFLLTYKIVFFIERNVFHLLKPFFLILSWKFYLYYDELLTRIITERFIIRVEIHSCSIRNSLNNRNL